jgi:hypothetical protein
MNVIGIGLCAIGMSWCVFLGVAGVLLLASDPGLGAALLGICVVGLYFFGKALR